MKSETATWATCDRPAYFVDRPKDASPAYNEYRAWCRREQRPTIIVRRQGRGSSAEVELETPCMFDTTAGAKLDALLGMPFHRRPEPIQGENIGTSIHVGVRPDLTPDELGAKLAAVVEEALPHLHWRCDIGPGARWNDVDDREPREADWAALAEFHETHGLATRERTGPKAKGERRMAEAYDLMPAEWTDLKSPRFRCDRIMKPAQVAEWREELDAIGDVSLSLGCARGWGEVARVDRRSPRPVRLAVAVLARYFHREFRYDFPLYDVDEPTDARDRVYLLHRENLNTPGGGRFGVGAFCFRWRDWTNAPHGLALSWLWLNPFVRNAGILSKLWPTFREVHGDFLTETPLSKAMDSFLKKRGECWRCGRHCTCGGVKPPIRSFGQSPD